MTRSANDLEKLYLDWTPRSRERADEASRWLPGGDTRASAHYPPYPVFMVEGHGATLVDLDGHEYIDFMNNFTSLIHGHAHAPTVRAVQEQVGRGSAYAAPTESQVELARLLCERVPSLDELRFTSSGSEATNMCVRAARAWTGRPKVMKVEGGYHGSHEIGEMSLVPLPGKSGPPERPETLAPDRSINASESRDVVTLPFNDAHAARSLLEEHADEVAALLVEPMLGGMGMIPPEPGYLDALRELTLEFEVPLVFDEVVTLRLAPGGLQQRAGVTPDLCAMGKIIGGGLPVGAFGGRREILEQFNPKRRDTIMHASTFSGNPLTMAAGLATLHHLDAADVDRINALGDALRSGIDAAFAEARLRGSASGIGSLVQIHFSDEPVRNARQSVAATAAAGNVGPLLHLGMLRRGVFAAGRGMYCISTAMQGDHVEAALAALRETLGELRDVIEQDRPDLVA